MRADGRAAHDRVGVDLRRQPGGGTRWLGQQQEQCDAQAVHTGAALVHSDALPCPAQRSERELARKSRPLYPNPPDGLSELILTGSQNDIWPNDERAGRPWACRGGAGLPRAPLLWSDSETKDTRTHSHARRE